MTDADDTYAAITAATQTTAVVVTTAVDGERGGCLVLFNTACSIDPPRYAVFLSKANHTTALADRADRVAVHVLAAGQHELARRMGSVTDWETDKFATVECLDVDGVPVLTEAVAWFTGPVVDRRDCGDHVLLVVAPDRAEGAVDDVLLFRDVRDLEPGNPT